MNVTLRFAVLVASFALVTDGASQGPARSLAEMNCSDEDHCQVVVTVKCHHVIFCDASVDFDGVNARGNNVFWKIADENAQQFAFDQRTGIEFKTDEGRKAFECMLRRLASTSRSSARTSPTSGCRSGSAGA